MYILAIETSCDDTSVAIINDRYRVLANQTADQPEHNKFGGIVPEIASRLHIKHIMRLTAAALEQAELSFNEIAAVAVSVNPGLIGSLLVGVSYAKALAFALDKPLIAVNHLLGHIYANRLTDAEKPPAPHPQSFLALVVSGGHTELVRFHSELDFEVVGRTTDDAAGEAFDKAAKLLGLGYPGGPLIDALSKGGNPKFAAFPRAFKQKVNYNFSYSGLKTSIMNYVRDKDEAFLKQNINHIAASIQMAIIEPLVTKTIRYALEHGISHILLAGGVSANSLLRSEMTGMTTKYKLALSIPPVKFCLDNASMIAAAAVVKYQRGQFAALDLNPFSTKGVREV